MISHIISTMRRRPSSASRAIDQAGEVVEFTASRSASGPLGQKLVGRSLVETELPLDNGMQLVALEIGHVAVDRGGVNKQRRRRETIVMVLEMGRMLAVFRDLGQEFAKVFEHTQAGVVQMGVARSFLAFVFSCRETGDTAKL